MIVAGIISLSLLSIVSKMVMCESGQRLEGILCEALDKELQESIDRCTCHRNIIETLFILFDWSFTPYQRYFNH